MAPKSEDGSWLRNGVEEGKSLDSISVRMSNMEVQGAFKSQQGGEGGESDGEGGDYNGCFPRGRKVYSDSANLKGAPFARLDTQQDAESAKAKFLGAIYCCCGPSGESDYSGEGGAVDMKGSGEDVELSSTECCKTPNYWKQLARRAKAHVYVRQAPHPSRGDWLNYDPHSYQMNFDDGCRREDNCDSSLYIDGNDDSVSREKAMQSALLKKFAASRAQRVS